MKPNLEVLQEIYDIVKEEYEIQLDMSSWGIIKDENGQPIDSVKNINYCNTKACAIGTYIIRKNKVAIVDIEESIYEYNKWRDNPKYKNYLGAVYAGYFGMGIHADRIVDLLNISHEDFNDLFGYDEDGDDKELFLCKLGEFIKNYE